MPLSHRPEVTDGSFGYGLRAFLGGIRRELDESTTSGAAGRP